MNGGARVALIHLMQETDTFNPVPTSLDAFANVALLEGDAVLRRVDANGPIAGVVEGFRAAGPAVTVVPVLRADAQSGGRLTRDALEELTRRATQGLAAVLPVDGLMVLLHGAACAEDVDDVEGHVLTAIREVSGPAVPLWLMLDHHANVTSEMMRHADLVMGFRTQPHDPFETARDLTALALRHLDGDLQPTTAWRKLPMITHQEQYLTARGPMKEWFGRARKLEAEGKASTISLFPMQPWLDVEEAGWSVVVVTDGDRAAAEVIADELADLAWALRQRFMELENVDVDAAIRHADETNLATVLLSDTGDSVLGGSTGDSTVILGALLANPPTRRALVPMTDPMAAAVLSTCSVGEHVTIDLGGWANDFYRPLSVTGTVRAVGGGTVQLDRLPQGSVDLGRAAVLEIGTITVLVTEHAGVGGIHPGVYRHLGVEPGEHKMIVMKTASNFQYMRDISTDFVRVATPGPTQSDVVSLPWARVPRPIFPLDEITEWRR